MSLDDALCVRLLPSLDGREGLDGLLDVTPSLAATKLLLRFDDRGTDLTNDHRAALPAPHVLRVGGDPTVKIFDGIHSAKLLVERVADAELLEGERRVESFEHGCGGTGMVGFEKVGEIVGDEYVGEM